MGTKLLLGFGSTANQAVAHLPMLLPVKVDGFGNTVIQAVFHLKRLPIIVSEISKTKR